MISTAHSSASCFATAAFFLNERVMVTGDTAELAGLQGKFGELLDTVLEVLACAPVRHAVCTVSVEG